jgi:Flp pilus assembly protein TadD
MYLGIAHLTQGANLDLGITLLKRALTQFDPPTAYPMIELALALERKGHAQLAVEWLDRARKKEPGRAEIYTSLGSILAAAGQSAAALKQYDEALKLDPNNAEIMFNRGEALAQLGRVDEAENAYHQAISTAPLMVQARNNLAGVLIQQGRLNEAEEQLNEALRIDPGADIAWATLGMVHANRADWPAAQHCLENAIKKTRDENRRAAFQNTLSQIRAQSGISSP